jgi:hypothetical protein
MSQKSSIDNRKNFTGQSSSQLNSKLQAVLGNLDVQLDNELARYRRKKRIEAQAPQPVSYRPPRSGNQKNIDLVVTPTPLERPKTESVEPLPFDQQEQELNSEENLDRHDSAASKSNLSPFSPQAALPQRLEATLSSSKQAKDQSDRAAKSANQQTSDLDQSAKEPPNDYLESSEKLLGSLDNPSGETLSTDLRRRRRRRRSLKSMLSPLTVGGTLLFVLAVGTLAHVLSGKFGDRTPVMTSNTESSTTQTPQTPVPEVPRSPNLADKEFVPLDLDTLGTLSGNTPQPTPTAKVPSSPPTPELQTSPTTSSAPNQTANQNYPSLENINTAILPQSVQDNPQNSATTTVSQSNSSNSNSESTDNSTTTATANNPDPAPANNTPTQETASQPTQPTQSTVNPQSFPAFFYVLIEYDNDDTLFIARDVVPDAYVREFPIGVKIQMGAFEDSASAQTMVNYLKEQGLAAQVYQP